MKRRLLLAAAFAALVAALVAVIALVGCAHHKMAEIQVAGPSPTAPSGPPRMHESMPAAERPMPAADLSRPSLGTETRPSEDVTSELRVLRSNSKLDVADSRVVGMLSTSDRSRVEAQAPGHIDNYSFHPTPTPPRAPGTESYQPIHENPFLDPTLDPLSTFGIDVDTASYANVRRFLTEGRLPPRDAVRIEEMVNYFPYDYQAPHSEDGLFAVMADATVCPWNAGHRLVRVAVKGHEMERTERPPSNLVFLIDVSGSMGEPVKLPLLQRGMEMMTERLSDTDRVAIVVYASESGVVLESTPCTRRNKDAILQALRGLHAGGTTHASAGIRTAYDMASSHFIEGGTNRVILATDGDFNVGTTNDDELVGLIRDKAQGRIFLSILGFGQGNLKDGRMEKLADKGNGNYAYIDSLAEARKVLVDQMAGTLVTIAKDVKVQVEFNPAAVAAYRLIGYEDRSLRPQDFNNDRKDAGEIGAGHCITAFYETVPAGEPVAWDHDYDRDARRDRPAIDPLKYQPGRAVVPEHGDAAEDRPALSTKRSKTADSTAEEDPTADLKSRAAAAEEARDWQSAYHLWTAIQARAASDSATFEEASRKIRFIKDKMDDQERANVARVRAEADSQTRGVSRVVATGDLPKRAVVPAGAATEMLTVKLRYKMPEGDRSRLVEMPLRNDPIPYRKASADFRFAAAVAQFGMLLRDSQFREGASYDAVIEEAESCLGPDKDGYRAEFVALVKKAQSLSRREGGEGRE